MKKIFLSVIAILVFLAVMAIHVNIRPKYNDFSDVSLANLEAIANVEVCDWCETIPEWCMYYCMTSDKVCTIINHTQGWAIDCKYKCKYPEF